MSPEMAGILSGQDGLNHRHVRFGWVIILVKPSEGRGARVQAFACREAEETKPPTLAFEVSEDLRILLHEMDRHEIEGHLCGASVSSIDLLIEYGNPLKGDAHTVLKRIDRP